MRIERRPDCLVVQLSSESDTERLGRALAAALSRGSVVGFVGPLGAGKTRLSRAISESFGVPPESIGSPTFTLIHEYPGTIPIRHFDTYRLRSPEDFDDLGASDYWASGDGICLIEWADRIWDRLPRNAWRVDLSIASPSSRLAEIRGPGLDELTRALEHDNSEASP